MTVTVLGAALRQIVPKMVGQNITNWFELVKPLVEFKWEVMDFLTQLVKKTVRIDWRFFACLFFENELLWYSCFFIFNRSKEI